MEEEGDNTELCLMWNDHAVILKNVLSALRYKGLYADVTLVCGTKQYAVHRFMLSTCSAYFENLLENIPGHHPVVVLTNTSAKDLEALLDFMYLGQTEVNSRDLDRLLDIASELKIKGLIFNKDDLDNQPPEDVADVEETVEMYDQPESVDIEDRLESEENDVKLDPEDPEDTEEIEIPETETESKENDLSILDTYVMPATDPLESLPEVQTEGEDTSQMVPEEIEMTENVRVKIEDRPMGLDSGLKEYQNFIQKYEQSEVAVPAVMSSDKSSMDKKISKPQDSRNKRGKATKTKLDKFKTDFKKQKERFGKPKTEHIKDKLKPVKKVDDNKTKIMMCPGCKKTFMSQSTLEMHMKTHDDLEIVSCVKCPYKALSQQQMQKHMLNHQHRIEQKSRPYRCPHCPSRLADRPSYLQHQKTLHPDKKVVDTVMSARVVLEDCKHKRIRQSKVLKDFVQS